MGKVNRHPSFRIRCILQGENSCQEKTDSCKTVQPQQKGPRLLESEGNLVAKSQGTTALQIQ